MPLKYKLPLVVLIALGSFLLTIRRHQTESAALSSVKDVLSSSQLSYFAVLGSGNSAGDTIVRINVASGTAPYSTTSNLSAGDTIGIGITNLGGILTNYTVKDIGNTGTIELNSGVGSSNAYFGLPIVATRSAIHTVYFTPVGNYTAGIFQFLIKATSRSGENHQDGIPDQQGFDLGATTPTSGATGLGTRLTASDVVCPLGATAGVGNTTTISTSSYHIISCTLGAGVTNQVGVGYTMTIGRDLASGSQLINPSASVNRTTEGSADTYAYYVRHLDSGSIVRDITQGRIAVVDAVRVTATVDPSITFAIGTSGIVTNQNNLCGSTMSSAISSVTGTAVPFGSLSLGAFNNLAQHLTCVTNAPNGYVVTAYEDRPLTRIGAGDTIPNTNCDTGTCTATTTGAWSTDTTESGFGYSLQNISVGTSAFSYQQGYRPFGVGAANAQTIMSNTSTPTANETAWICYRLVASTLQKSGDYDNKLVFTATATF